jgi:hypothetical protein
MARSALGAGLLSAGLAAGCSSPPPAPARVPYVRATPALTSPSQLTIGTLRYEPSTADDALIARAVTTVADRCIRSLGVSPPPGNLVQVALYTPGAIVGLEVQWLTVPGAARFGYAAPEDQQNPELLQLDRQQGDIELGVSGRSRQARDTMAAILGLRVRELNGHQVPPGGCLDLAGRELGTDGRSAADLGFMGNADVAWRLSRQAGLRMVADPRVAAVTARWRACMRRAGFGYRDPQAAQADRRWNSQLASATELHKTNAEQITVATADARCRAQVNYSGVRLAVWRAYLAPLLRTHLAQLRQYQSQLQTVLAKARAVRPGS